MNLLLEKLYLEKKEFVESDMLKKYCKSLKLDYTSTIKNLLNSRYLVRIFRGIFYVRPLEDKKLGKSKYSAWDLVIKGLELKGIKNWYFGLNTAIKLNNLTHEFFTMDYIMNDKIFRANPITIEGKKFKFIKLKPELLTFGIKESGDVKYSDHEKTILDFIYLRKQNGTPDERIILEISEWAEGVSEAKIKKYLKFYPKTVARVFEEMKR
jgi:hypothetical protein